MVASWETVRSLGTRYFTLSITGRDRSCYSTENYRSTGGRCLYHLAVSLNNDGNFTGELGFDTLHCRQSLVQAVPLFEWLHTHRRNHPVSLRVTDRLQDFHFVISNFDIEISESKYDDFSRFSYV